MSNPKLSIIILISILTYLVVDIALAVNAPIFKEYRILFFLSLVVSTALGATIGLLISVLMEMDE